MARKKSRDEIRAEAEKILASYLEHPTALEMKKYIQHGDITTYDHALAVAHRCYRYAYKRRVNIEELTVAAFLHDLYLYDWHEPDKSHKWHGYHHAKRASENAERIFSVSPHVKSMIATHMWPLNLTKLPRSREAWILTLTDKAVSLGETVNGFYKKIFGKRSAENKSR